MANEASLRDRIDHPIDFTVADGTGIEKGALLKMSDPRTAATHTAAQDILAGIAAREKVASDGRTRLAVFRRGIFDMVASGAIIVGEAVVSDASINHVKAAPTGSSGATILGHALENGSTGETIQIFVDVGAGGGV